jgi:hypothetical protein
MPKDMYGQELAPGDVVMHVSYNRPNLGVIKKLTEACIIIDCIYLVPPGKGSYEYKFNRARVQPYRPGDGRRQEMLVKLSDQEYERLSHLAGIDVRHELLKKDPSIFEKNSVY